MVTIKSYQERKTASGKTFLVLELEGGLEIVTSQSTGRLYASTKRCTIPCTFDEEVAEKMIGTSLPGTIVRVPCEAYSYVSPKTQETMTLNYRYSYVPSESNSIEAKNSVKRIEEVEVL